MGGAQGIDQGDAEKYGAAGGYAGGACAGAVAGGCANGVEGAVYGAVGGALLGAGAGYLNADGRNCKDKNDAWKQGALVGYEKGEQAGELQKK
mmetsp:Transcript_49702/g.118364  ORF Transcript_49702/g.118364 Transcript_49702/m.118364 type:complete len:93 (-) Transcript_49702:156-434(-)|eukprot:CAMPEP_0181475224 /NCGR_PEP_ID=MMETSP1110-20121109/41073_1 /TAXON_ID=174948 /ORGANISM="Symbiodinium sp., Strain CCMP421" /LENGTH=92 /DNA_ID=CAMNT_0023600453 /DNA_START=71 /DNA_END=349 /DNA_ORIENTATION=+